MLAWWLTRAARLGTALVLLAGLAGAAGDAARRESQSTFAADPAGDAARRQSQSTFAADPAGDAARRQSQSTFAGAAGGRVAEVVLTGPGGYPMPGPRGFDPPARPSGEPERPPARRRRWGWRARWPTGDEELAGRLAG